MTGMRKTRSVSEVISSLLVLFIVVSIGVAIYAYSTNIFSSMLENYANAYLFNSLVLKERFIIEDVWFTGNNSLIKITIFNYGSITVTISAIFINDTLISQPNMIIEPGHRVTININSIWNYNASYYIKVLSSRGVIIEGIYKAS